MTARAKYVRGSSSGRISRRGFGLLDLTLSLAIGAMATAGLFQLEADTQSGLQAVGLAQTMNEVTAASKAYLSSYSSTILANTGVGDVVSIPITGSAGPVAGTTSLTAAGVLPSSFTANAPLGQSLAVLVAHQPATAQVPEHLQALVTTYGGSGLTDRQLGLVVNKIGGAGGAMMHSPPPEISPATVQGAYGGWSYPSAAWRTSTGFQPTTGHVMETLDLIGAPVSEYLDRYNTGNPEANRMHTAIDMNNNTVSNTLGVYSQGTNDLYLQDVNHPGRVMISNGGMACLGDATGCHFDVSNDGGFFDYNTGWVDYQGNYGNAGLRISGNGNNFDVGGHSEVHGVTQADNGVNVMGNSQVNFASWGGSLGMTDGNWIRATGADGFQGIIAPIMAASKFVDENNSTYYVVPSGTSYLNYVNMQTGWVQGTLDVVGQFHAHANAQVDGDAAVNGQIGTNWFDPHKGLPSSLVGGVHTWDVYAEGTIVTGVNGSIDTVVGGRAPGDMSQGAGVILASTAVGGQVIRPLLVATPGAECGQAAPANVAMNLGGTPSSAPAFQVEDGDIARDASGMPLYCVKGTWTNPNTPFSTMIASGTIPLNEAMSFDGNGASSNGALTNNSGRTLFVTMMPNAASTHSATGQWTASAYVNGVTACMEGVHISTGHVSIIGPSCSFVVPPGALWYMQDGQSWDNEANTQFTVWQ